MKLILSLFIGSVAGIKVNMWKLYKFVDDPDLAARWLDAGGKRSKAASKMQESVSQRFIIVDT